MLIHGYSQLVDPDAEQSFFATFTDLPQSLAFSREAVFYLGMKAAVALLILALLDFAYQKLAAREGPDDDQARGPRRVKRMEGTRS